MWVLSHAAVRSPQHAVVLAPTQEVSFFEIDAWPRSFVVTVFLVVLEKGGRLVKQRHAVDGPMSERNNQVPLWNVERHRARHYHFQTTGWLQGCEGLALRSSRVTHLERYKLERSIQHVACPVCRLRRQGTIEFTARLFVGDHLSGR